MSAFLDFLTSEHPIYTKTKDRWRRAERRLRGGWPVIDQELQKFIWEGEPDFELRKHRAAYPNFEAGYLLSLYGHILREAPRPDKGLAFGALGPVLRPAGQTSPTLAELVYFNVDGVGGDGQQFYAWLMGVAMRAGATGHRWVMVEHTEERPGTVADWMAGKRPYAVEYSPLAVPNWDIRRGQLQWMIVKIPRRAPASDGSRWTGNAYRKHTLLLVRKGFTELDDLAPSVALSGGGWWELDDRGNFIDGKAGNWDRTNGEIPMTALYHLTSVSDDEDYPAMSQSGCEVLGNLSAAFMNQESARESNAWRSASDPLFLLGVDSESFKTARDVWEGGSFIVPVPPTQEGNIPTVQSGATGVVASEVFGGILEDIVAEAERQAALQATSTPDSSGRSKEVGFAEKRGPVLSLAAENLESGINSILRFFELRAGYTNPTAEIRLPREFDLEAVADTISRFFETFRVTRLRSPTLEVKAAMALADDAGLVADDAERTAIEAELKASAGSAATAAAQARAQEDEIDVILSGVTGANGNGRGVV